MRGVVAPREQAIQRRRGPAVGLALLHRRPRAVGVTWRVAAPEVQVPLHELGRRRAATLVVPPVLDRERGVASINREPLVAREIAIAFGQLAEEPRLDQRPRATITPAQ